LIFTREYLDTDFELIQSWYSAYPEWAFGVPKAFLSATGYIVEIDGAPVAAGFLFTSSNSKICFAEWIIVDPKADKELRGPAIKEIYNALAESAKSAGMGILITLVKHEGLINKLLQQGFMKGDSGMTTLIKELK